LCNLVGPIALSHICSHFWYDPTNISANHSANSN